MCGCAVSVMLLILAVVLPTPHDYSGTFQGGYSARFIASRRVPKGARRALSTIHPSLGMCGMLLFQSMMSHCIT